MGEAENEAITARLNIEPPNVFLLHKNGKLVTPNHPFYTQVNANKILDGLFIGNQEAAQEIDFISSIKCNHIINCAGHSVPNLFSRLGVRYLTLRWLDCKTQILFGGSDLKTFHQIVKFVEPVLNRGEAIFIHSQHGNSRAACVIVAILMYRFRWGVTKCIEFVKFRRPEILPKPYFVKQLRKLEKKLNIIPDRVTSVEDRWLSSCDGNLHIVLKEMTVRNTFLNGHYIFPPPSLNCEMKRTRRVNFTKTYDENQPFLDPSQQQKSIIRKNILVINESPREREESQPEQQVDVYSLPPRIERRSTPAWESSMMTAAPPKPSTPESVKRHPLTQPVLRIRNHAWVKPATPATQVKRKKRRKKKATFRSNTPYMNHSNRTKKRRPETRVVSQRQSTPQSPVSLFHQTNFRSFINRDSIYACNNGAKGRKLRKTQSTDQLIHNRRRRRSSGKKKKKTRRRPRSAGRRPDRPLADPGILVFGNLL